MNLQPPRLFIDTNVWFSTFYGSPTCEKLLKAHIEGTIVAVVSTQVLKELVNNIQEKIPVALPAFEKLIATAPPLTLQDPKAINPKVKSLVHPKDQKVFCSILDVENIRYFITGNTKHFSKTKLKKVTGVTVLTPKEAANQFQL